MKHPEKLPSTYATVQVGYGSSQSGHLYHTDDFYGLNFHPDREAADAEASRLIAKDPLAIIAVLKVETLFAARVDIQAVVKAK